MEHEGRHSGWRWTVLGTIILNTVFNNLYNLAGLPGKSVSQVSDTYHSLFTPAGYAFSIWGAIYLAFLIYAVYQLLPAQRHNRFFDRMAGPLIFANVLCMAWQVLFRNEFIGASVAVIIVTLCTAVAMQVIVRKETHNHSLWLTVPFSLFLGWICVATIANVASWLLSMGWNGGPIAPETWAIIVIALALLVAILLSLAYRDFVVPLVIAWALAAIYVETLYNYAGVANIALAGGIIGLFWAAGISLLYQKKSFNVEISRHSADA